MVGILEGEYLGILELDCTGRSQYGPWSFLVLLAGCALVSMVQYSGAVYDGKFAKTGHTKIHRRQGQNSPQRPLMQCSKYKEGSFNFFSLKFFSLSLLIQIYLTRPKGLNMWVVGDSGDGFLWSSSLSGSHQKAP